VAGDISRPIAAFGLAAIRRFAFRPAVLLSVAAWANACSPSAEGRFDAAPRRIIKSRVPIGSFLNKPFLGQSFRHRAVKSPIHHGPSSVNMPSPGAAKHAVCGSTRHEAPPLQARPDLAGAPESRRACYTPVRAIHSGHSSTVLGATRVPSPYRRKRKSAQIPANTAAPSQWLVRKARRQPSPSRPRMRY
jgi:hypothetical protein